MAVNIDTADPREPGADEVILERLENTPRTAWRILARNQASALFDQVREAEGTHHLSDSQTVQAKLIRQGISRAAATTLYSPARWKARKRPPSPLGIWEALNDWYAGAGVETAWSELHRADERLLLVQNPQSVRDPILSIDAALRTNLKEDAPRLPPATDRLKELADRTAPAPVAQPAPAAQPAPVAPRMRQELGAAARGHVLEQFGLQ